MGSGTKIGARLATLQALIIGVLGLVGALAVSKVHVLSGTTLPRFVAADAAMNAASAVQRDLLNLRRFEKDFFLTLTHPEERRATPLAGRPPAAISPATWPPSTPHLPPRAAAPRSPRVRCAKS